MLVDAKPPLDEDLLLHYGIPGMKWGQRHDYIPKGIWGHGRSAGGGGGSAPRPRGGSASSGGSVRRSSGTAPRHTGMSKGKKIAIGVGVVGGAAAAAYFLSKTGTRPHASAMTSRSNRAGLKMTMGILKTSGKVSVASIKGGAKVTKVGAKVGYKTTKVVGKGAGKAGKAVAKNSAKATSDFIKNLKKPSGPPKAVRGEKFGKMLLGEYGPNSTGGGLAYYVPNRRKRK